MGVDAFAESGADMLVIAKRLYDLVEVLGRVKDVCHSAGCRIVDIYGVDQDEVRSEIDSCRFLTYGEWQSLTEPYDVVSFEIANTLMIRDVFWPDKMTLRPVFGRLIPWLKERGKAVLYMGWENRPDRVQEDALIDSGLATEESLKTDLIMRTGKDHAFRTVLSRFPNKKILHIGIDVELDGVFPRIYGIDTWKITFFEKKELLPEPESADIRPHPAGGRESRESVLAAIAEADVVSFDIFDTLLMRTVLRPEDVFEMAARRAAARTPVPEDLVKWRVFAQSELKVGTYDEIYDLMISCIPDQKAACAVFKEEELKAERDVLEVRGAVLGLLEEARRLHKGVVLTSDMYLPSSVMRELLANLGIVDYDALFISCEARLLKAEGLFDRVRKFVSERFGPGASILHIGDSEEADVRPAKRAGFRAVRLPSPMEAALAGSKQKAWRAAFEKAVSFEERCLLGLSLARVFADPFGEPETEENNGKPAEAYLRAYAASAAAPVIVGHLTWLISELQKERPDGVLFVSRDGWLERSFYEEIRGDLPSSCYFYTNRRVAFRPVEASPGSVSFIAGLARRFAEDFGPERILASYYGLKEAEIKPLSGPDEPLDRYIGRHAAAILEHEEEARHAYYRYMRRCGLKIAARYAMVDFVASGTCQMYLAKFAPFELTGYYYGRPNYDSGSSVDIRTYLKGEEPYLLTHFMDMEFIMTSPEPSLDSFDEEGEPVFAAETRSEEERAMIEVIHDEIRQYFYAYRKLVGDEAFGRVVIAPALVETMYAAGGSEGIRYSSFDDWGQFSHSGSARLKSK